MKCRRSTILPKLLAAAGGLTLSTAARAQNLCGDFVAVPSPGQGVAGSVLSAVAANGTTGFAVGRFYPGGAGPFVPLLYRLAGSEWLEQPLPSGPPQATNLVLMSAGMSPATNSDAWIVGYVDVPPPTTNLPLIARWRDGSFDRVETPELRPQTVYPFGPRSGFGYDVSVVARDDVWVVGIAVGFGDAVASSVAMALHWTGSGWEDVPTVIVATRTNEFDAVSAPTSSDVWAVGTSRNIGQAYYGLIQRWDGARWNVVDHPAQSLPASQFHEVLAFPSGEVWVAGAVNYTDPLLYRWNGASWESMPLPGGGAVIAMAGRAPNDFWASSAGPVFSLFHWDGAAWTEVPNPPPPSGLVDSTRGLAIAGPCDVWAVGSQMNSTGFFGTLIEHLEPRGCPADFNRDGQQDFFDYLDFAVAFDAQDPRADFDANGQIDFFDYLDFVGAFDAGCD
jgi:hypothetical protein